MLRRMVVRLGLAKRATSTMRSAVVTTTVAESIVLRTQSEVSSTTANVALRPPSLAKNNTSYNKVVRTLLAAGAVGAGVTIYGIMTEPRERSIIAKAINGHSFVSTSDSEAYAHVQDKVENASLSAILIVDRESGKRYLKKGAQSRHQLIKEFSIANILAMLRPGIQPESLILQDRAQAGEKTQFYTLSRVYDNTMDLEDFALLPDWRERLQKKPLVGFEVALASDLMFAKQQDMKLANYIISEREDCYVVAAIDHELAGENFFDIKRSLNQRVFTDDIRTLVGRIRDLHDPEDYKIGLAGDPRGKAFVEEAIKHMNPESVRAFYRRVIVADLQPAVTILTELESKTDLVKPQDIRELKSEIEAIQSGARNYLEKIDEAPLAVLASRPKA